MSTGYIYVLANSAMPDLVKVGFTTRDPGERARELSAVTGVPMPFLVVYKRYVGDCEAAEAYVHTQLGLRGFRVADNREFFRAPISDVVEAVASVPFDLAQPTNPSFAEAVNFDDGPAVAPWRGLWEQAEAAYFGEGDEFQDLDHAKRLYEDSLKLGCVLAHYRLVAIASKAGGKNHGEALLIAKRGVSQGNYACLLLLVRLFLASEQTENAKKALASFFRERAKRRNDALEAELLVVRELCSLIAAELHFFFSLDVDVLSELQRMKDVLVRGFDEIIEYRESNGLPLIFIGPYHEARVQIESLP